MRVMAGGATQQSLRRALGALKDTTTVSLAKVNSEFKVLAIFLPFKHFPFVISKFCFRLHIRNIAFQSNCSLQNFLLFFPVMKSINLFFLLFQTFHNKEN